MTAPPYTVRRCSKNLALAKHEIWATNDPAYKSEPGACFCLKFSEKVRNLEEEDSDDTN